MLTTRSGWAEMLTRLRPCVCGLTNAGAWLRLSFARSGRKCIAQREAHPGSALAERLRGRRGVEQRKRRLMLEPLCRDCKEQGRITAATVPDHITPLALGGTDTDDNIRCLCKPCHDKRTAEQFGHSAKVQIGLDGWPLR